jgi:1-aminocyclopropane-1-carboxylate deaminase
MAIYDRVGNILMSRVMGAEVELVDEGFDIGIRESCERALEDVRAKGGKPYAIPAGASVHRYGGLGFVGFAEEVREQEQELEIRFDYIIVCTMTGSTHAGGFAKDGRSRKVIGIDASGTGEQTRAQVLAIARGTADLVELGREITEDDLRPDRGLRLPGVRRPLCRDQRCNPPRGPDGGHDDRPGLRG